MKDLTKDFLKLLYNEGETICISPDKYAYHSVEQSDLNKEEISMISPNEKVKPFNIKESDIILATTNPVNGFRKDENVTAFRTFLIELDDGKPDEQMKYIESTGMPWSICVFSGNKSLHYGIVLEGDMPDITYWRYYNEWLLNIVGKADQQNKNPSRNIRFPGNKRKDGAAKVQTLRRIKGRVDIKDFLLWISLHQDKKPIIKKAPIPVGRLPTEGELPKWIKTVLEEGVSSDRNNSWFNITCNMARCNFDLERTVSILEGYFNEESDFSRKEWLNCIKSAYKKVQGENV